jgi:spermidine synthase
MVAAGGLLLARGVDRAGGEARPKVVRLSGAGDGTVWHWSLLVFVGGFLVVTFQIVWYRLVGVLRQSNSYSFSLVLTVFLLGDAAGLPVGVQVIARIADPRRFN